MKVAAHDNVIGIRAVEWDCKYPKRNGQIKVPYLIWGRVVHVSIQEVVMIVMELARGGEFFDFMMYTGAFPEPIAKTFFRQLIEGVLYCHSVGVYHRDLKPENLLLDDRFSLKVCLDSPSEHSFNLEILSGC
jgi:serine/threonine protein kinase